MFIIYSGVNDNMGNNLNKSNPDNDKSFTKNIELSGQGEHKGDQAMLDEMNALMQATTRELEVDAAAAIEGLKQDREIMEKLEEIKKRKVKEGDDRGSFNVDRCSLSYFNTLHVDVRTCSYYLSGKDQSPAKTCPNRPVMEICDC